MGDSNACATCNKTGAMIPSCLVPIVGMVCRECFDKLAAPTLLEGVIEGPSVLTLSRSTLREFEERRQKIRDKAKAVCERFAALVESGAKRQTIRPPRKRPIKVGDTLDLRKWSGRAYASKQVKLRTAVCEGVITATVDETGVTLVNGDSKLRLEGVNGLWFAQQDGFHTFADMKDWFESTHGLPFTGDLIRWGGERE